MASTMSIFQNMSESEVIKLQKFFFTVWNLQSFVFFDQVDKLVLLQCQKKPNVYYFTSLFNLLQPSAAFLNPLKTSENLKVF